MFIEGTEVKFYCRVCGRKIKGQGVTGKCISCLTKELISWCKGFTAETHLGIAEGAKKRSGDANCAHRKEVKEKKKKYWIEHYEEYKLLCKKLSEVQIGKKISEDQKEIARINTIKQFSNIETRRSLSKIIRKSGTYEGTMLEYYKQILDLVWTIHPPYCVRCGEYLKDRDRLEVVVHLHHRDPSTKVFEILASCWKYSIEENEEEIRKCDPMCGGYLDTRGRNIGWGRSCHSKLHIELRRNK